MSILILAGGADSQVRCVVERLTRKHADFIFLDHESPLNFYCDFESDGDYSLTVEGRRFRPSTVWCRLKIDVVFPHWDLHSSREFVARSEWRAMMNALATLYREASVQKRDLVWRMELKPVQFALAAQVGFQLPASRFFIGKQNAQDFVARRAHTVGKVIKTKLRPSGELGRPPDRLMTFDVTSDIVSEAAEPEFKVAPSFFQERLKAGREYRVIAFPGRSFTYRVLGDLSLRERPDERFLHGHSYAHEPTPPLLQSLIDSFLAVSGLGYAAFDLVLDDDGSWWFLECNPEGQWSAANAFNLEEVLDTFIETCLLSQGSAL